MQRFNFLSISLILLVPMPGWAQDAKKITYDEHVQPLLREKCFSCHNQDKQRGGVALHNFLAVMEGGSSGKIVEPGDPESSKLYRVMAHLEEPVMPPKSPKLPDPQLALIKDWIQGGALENAGSKAKVTNKPKVEMTVSAAELGKPSGPPPIPPDHLELEPPIITPRGNAVQALAANPWSTVLAVGGQKSVLLYDTKAKVLLGVLPFPEGTPHVLKFSRNGAVLLAGGGIEGRSGIVVVWDVRTGERLLQVGDETDTVLAADISPDQSIIALGGPSKVLRVYSTKDGEKLHEIKKHTDWITAIEFSPDGVLLASGDRNGGLHVWESASGQEHLALRGHSAFITGLSWRIDSNVLASSSEDATIRLWEVENGRQLRSWAGHGGGSLGVSFAKDGRLATVGRDRTPKLWDQAGKQLKAYEALPDVGLAVAVSDEAKRIAVSDWTGTIRLFEVDSGAKVGELASNPPARAEQLRAADASLAEAKAKLQAAAAGLPALQEQLAKSQAARKASQQTVAQAQAQAKAVAAELTAAQATLAPMTAAKEAAQAAIPAKEAVAKLLAEAAEKAKQASEQQQGNTELAAYAQQSSALAAKSQSELTAAQKYASDLVAAAKPLEDKVNATVQADTQIKAALAEAEKKLAAAVEAEKSAANQFNTAKAASAALELEVAGLEKYRQRLQQSLAQLGKGKS